MSQDLQEDNQVVQDCKLLQFLGMHQNLFILQMVLIMEHQFVVNLQEVVQEDTILDLLLV